VGARAGADAQARRPVFAHGVASGDPLADRVILWTRVTPPAGAVSPLEVRWRVARDPRLQEVLAEGTLIANAARDYTAKVDAGGLPSGATLYYGFEADGQTSPMGRTRTLPVGSPARMRLAVASCANAPSGFFNAYACMAARDDFDAVVHLGDYLYEYGAGRYPISAKIGREPDPPHEIVSLSDYRLRHAFYKRDLDLQAVHARHPFVAVWDDHESANDAWREGAQNHDAGEGSWAARKAAATRAYFEWMPVRESGDGHTWRRLPFGDLADLLMLDTRLQRDEQTPGDARAAADPTRSILGARQERWLHDTLAASNDAGVAWRVIGQQVMLAPLRGPDGAFGADGWHGYRASRARLLDRIESHAISDVVVLTGDIHSSWALDVPRDPWNGYDAESGRGSLAVEIVTPAISAQPLRDYSRPMRRYGDAQRTHPHVHWVDFEHRGYVVLDVDRERARAEWWLVDQVETPSCQQRLAAAFETRRGSSHLVRA
jgi:alkaline phosphatase D